MARFVTTFDPYNPAKADATSFNTGTTGVFQMVVWNESNANLTLVWGQHIEYAPAWTATLFCVQTNTANIDWAIYSNLTSPAGQISQVGISTYGAHEFVPGTYPASLANRQSVTNTATGNPIFSATVGYASTVHLLQFLNVFNPPTSGKNYTFHAARVFTSDAGTPSAVLEYCAGADNKFAGAVTAFSHMGTATPPTSAANCTQVDSGTVVLTNPQTIETLSLQPNVTADLLAFPDSVVLAPGGNMILQMTGTATAKIVRLTLKWTESVTTV